MANSHVHPIFEKILVGVASPARHTELENELAKMIIFLLNDQNSTIDAETRQLAMYSIAKVVGYGHPIFDLAN